MGLFCYKRLSEREDCSESLVLCVGVMEGCSNYPLPSTDLPVTKASTSTRSRKKDVVHMERNRREKMSEFYAILQSMVPTLFPRATRTRIIDETIVYIKQLEEVIMIQEAQKAAIATPNIPAPMLITHTSSSVDITVSGNTAFFGICSISRPGLLTKVLDLFDKYKAEVLATTVASNERNTNLTVTAVTPDEEVVEMLKGELMII